MFLNPYIFDLSLSHNLSNIKTNNSLFEYTVLKAIPFEKMIDLTISAYFV